jgi:hypothetical protein
LLSDLKEIQVDGLAPTLKLLLAVKSGIERGESIRTTTQKYIVRENDELSRLVATWLSRRDQGVTTGDLLKNVKSPFRQSALQIVDRGLSGESIYQQLLLLEEETIEAAKFEIETFLSLLPIKMLVPLLLLQFPAFLLLLFGPLLAEFLKQTA